MNFRDGVWFALAIAVVSIIVRVLIVRYPAVAKPIFTGQA